MNIVQLHTQPLLSFLELIDAMGPLTRRETKLIWHLLACTRPLPLGLLPDYSPAAARGLSALVRATDGQYVAGEDLAIAGMLAQSKQILKSLPLPASPSSS